MEKKKLVEACERAKGICKDCELAHKCKECDSEAETNSAGNDD